MSEEYICCFCGRRFKDSGNSPEPVQSEGRCCNDCNAAIVIPARIKGLKAEMEKFKTAKEKGR